MKFTTLKSFLLLIILTSPLVAEHVFLKDGDILMVDRFLPNKDIYSIKFGGEKKTFKYSDIKRVLYSFKIRKLNIEYKTHKKTHSQQLFLVKEGAKALTLRQQLLSPNEIEVARDNIVSTKFLEVIGKAKLIRLRKLRRQRLENEKRQAKSLAQAHKQERRSQNLITKNLRRATWFRLSAAYHFPFGQLADFLKPGPGLELNLYLPFNWGPIKPMGQAGAYMLDGKEAANNSKFFYGRIGLTLPYYLGHRIAIWPALTAGVSSGTVEKASGLFYDASAEFNLPIDWYWHSHMGLSLTTGLVFIFDKDIPSFLGKVHLGFVFRF